MMTGRRHFARRGWATLCVLLLAAAAFAQDRPGGVSPLTLEGAIMLAAGASQSLERARLEVEASLAGLERARAARRPVIDANAGAAYVANPPDGVTIPAGAFGTVTDPTSTFPAKIPENRITLVPDPENLGLSLSVQLDQPLFTWGRIAAGESAAVAAVEVSASRRELSLRDLRRSVTIAYAAVLAGRESVPVVEEIVRVLDERVADARAQLEAGAITRGELLAAESRLATAGLQLVRSRQGLATAEAGLERLIGVDPGPLAPVELPVRLPEEAELLRRSRAASPRLGELRAVGSQAAVGLDVAESSRPLLPDLGLSVKAEVRGQRVPLVQSNWIDSWDANVTISVGARATLFDGGLSRADRASAQARYGQALSAIAEYEESIPLQVRSSVEYYLVAGAMRSEARARLAAAEEQRRVARVSFENELITRADLLGATLSELESRLAAVAATMEAARSLAEIEYLAGPLQRKTD